MNPEVSVIMKVLNGEEYVEASIKSILAQSFKNFEFIIVDDGSSDGTWDLLVKCAKKDARIILVRNEKNLGIPGSGNICLEMVRGPYVAVQDADDWSYPDRLEKQVNFLQAHQECVALGSMMMVVDDAGQPIRIYTVPLAHQEIDHFHINGFSGLLAHPTMVACTNAVRAVGGYREKYPLAEDFDLLLRLAEWGKLHNLPDVLVRYVQHSKNMTREKNDQMRFLKKTILEETWERRGFGTYTFDRIPNPTMKLSKSSKNMSLIHYGLREILRNPLSREGWWVLKVGVLKVMARSKG